MKRRSHVGAGGGLLSSWLYVAVGFLCGRKIKRDRENAKASASPIVGHVFLFENKPRPCLICTNSALQPCSERSPGGTWLGQRSLPVEGQRIRAKRPTIGSGQFYPEVKPQAPPGLRLPPASLPEVAQLPFIAHSVQGFFQERHTRAPIVFS